jgi:hypothetical protein
MSGREFAQVLSWQASKVSKLENGRQTPSDDDIGAWTAATGSEAEAPALLASLHTLEIRHAEWQRQLRGGLKGHQSEIAAINARTRFFRVFESTYIPGLLQTAEYIRARVAQTVAVFGVDHDVDDTIKVRLQRQDVLYRSEKRFHFVITEAALRYRLCPLEAMLGQLDRLISLAALPNVKLGVIGFDTACGVAPAHGFWLLDEDRVMVETFSAELNLAQPQEIELYGKVFENLAAVASYGRPARAIVTRVIDDLADGLPEISD